MSSWSQDDLLEWVRANPDRTAPDASRAKGENLDQIRRRFRKLLRDERVIRSGAGTQQDPFRYRAVD